MARPMLCGGVFEQSQSPNLISGSELSESGPHGKARPVIIYHQVDVARRSGSARLCTVKRGTMLRKRAHQESTPWMTRDTRPSLLLVLCLDKIISSCRLECRPKRLGRTILVDVGVPVRRSATPRHGPRAPQA